MTFTEALKRAKEGAYIARPSRFYEPQIFFVWIWVSKQERLGFLAKVTNHSTVEYGKITDYMENATDWEIRE